MACGLIQKPDENDPASAIAYMVSIEKIFSDRNEENVLVKISSLQKRGLMRNFKWEGDARPNFAATK